MLMYSAAMYTPTPLPGGGQAKVCSSTPPDVTKADEQTEIEVILEESGGDEDRKRYKVTLTPANKIDMNAIVEYCQGAKQSEKAKDISVCLSSPL
jgi:arylamine N-acetyltransferase